MGLARHVGRSPPLRSGQSPWLIPETGRKIALSQIVEQGDEAPDSLAARHAFDAHQVGARRLPDEEAGTRQPPAHRVRLAARDGDTFVDDTLIQDRGDDVCGTPEWLEAFDPGKRLREHTDQTNSRVVLLQAPPHARGGAAGPDADDDMGELASRLLENLRGGRFVVRTPGIVIAVLVAEGGAFRGRVIPPVDL